jgi:ADP-ribose pyrophosphatase YjhB (NUDIX family)
VDKHSHCGYCGTRFIHLDWPRTCSGCKQMSWVNPLPVSVVLLPVDDGLLLVRRAIPPVGELALPGGYINLGESWQEAGARELFEETGIQISPNEIQDFHVRSAPKPDTLLIVFGLARPRKKSDLPAFVPNDETQAITVVSAPIPLAFSLHTDAMAEWFAKR